MKIVLHPQAEREFVQIALYYADQRHDLGADFVIAVGEAIAGIRQFPHRWTMITQTVRRGLLRRFPYAFYYREKIPGEELEILSISHTKRDPRHWLGRQG